MDWQRTILIYISFPSILHHLNIPSGFLWQNEEKKKPMWNAVLIKSPDIGLLALGRTPLEVLRSLLVN